MSEPLIALAVGVVVGPLDFDLVPLDFSNETDDAIFREAAQVILALSVMGAALRLPRAYEVHHWRELLVVLGLGMPLMWLATATLMWGVLVPVAAGGPADRRGAYADRPGPRRFNRDRQSGGKIPA